MYPEGIVAFLLAQSGASLVAVFAVLLLASGVGLPFPAMIFVLAGGALAREGAVQLPLILISGWVAVVAGDFIGYAVGRWAGQHIPRRWTTERHWADAETRFARDGGRAIFLTRWLLTPLAVPTALIAGLSRFPAGRFLAFDGLGEAVWLGLYGGLGYFLGAQWQAAGASLQAVINALVVLVLIWGAWRYRRFLRQRSAIAPKPPAGH